MYWLLIFLCVVFSLLAYILLAPICIDIDSKRGLYGIRFHRVASLGITLSDKIRLEINLFGWKKQLDPFIYNQKKGKPSDQLSDQSKSINADIKLNKVISLLKSFTIKTFEISFDSYNMQLNGMLFPLFYFAGFYFKKNIRISFTGENYCILKMENTLGRMAIAYIKA